MTGLIVFFLYVPLIHYLTKSGLSFFYRRQWTTLNYKGESVAASFGLMFIVHYALFWFGLWMVQLKWTAAWWWRQESMPLFWFILFLTVLGWLDDRYGTKETKGFKGHLRALYKDRKVTTGLLKAAGGWLLSILVSFNISSDLFSWIVHALVIVLAMHVSNLLDVRPGRAVKGFWCFSLGLLPWLDGGFLLSVYLPVFLSTIVLFQYDRLRLAMLGDTGALVLGGVLGLVVVHATLPGIDFVYFIVFTVLSILAEKVSFTAWIEQSPWLSKIDQWGIR